MAPSTFASAAAGNNAQSLRNENSSGGDWGRRNGNTATFRRPSLATTLSNNAHQRDTSSTSNAGVYIPPHANRNGTLAEDRYSKEQLLSLLREQQDTNALATGLSDLYAGGWEPPVPNGAAAWQRRDEQPKDTQPSADICWEHDGAVLPLALIDLTDEEREIFATSVNSMVKPPQQSNKDGTPRDNMTRKTSVSQSLNSPGPFGLSSPTSARPQRRREASDAYPFPDAKAEPSRFRQESHATTPPPALQRRRTDYKDSAVSNAEERDKDKKAEESAPLSGLGSLRRSVTSGTGGNMNGPSSPWASTTPTSAAFSPMGSFGALGGLGASTTADKRSGLSGMRTGSRFKDLMNPNDPDSTADSRLTLSELTEASEAETGQRQAPTSWQQSRQDRPFSDATDPYTEDEAPPGSANPRGGADQSPPRSRFFGLGTPQRSNTIDENGFGAFGMTADPAAVRDSIGQRGDFPHQTPHHQGGEGALEQMSPTDTNPYQSPEHDRHEEDEAADIRGLGSRMGTFNMEQSGTIPGLGGFGSTRGAPGSFDLNAGDRSQTSSTGPSRGFPSLSGLGGLPGLGNSSTWSTHQNLGTPQQGPSRYNEAFVGGAFGQNELQSPGLAALVGLGGLGAGGPISRGSKMSSIFPSGMQEQMQGNDGRGFDGSADSSQQDAFGTIGRSPFGGAAPSSAGPLRDTDSPFNAHRGILEDILSTRSPFAGGDAPKPPFGLDDGNAPLQTPTLANAGQGPLGSVAAQQRQSVDSSASNQPPALQQRQMVMPDRMRWVYKDPQGHQQGPWTGLEMHEWYKAGFFSPELQIKKEEDIEFEPLAHLIRRIGNSREPFLVPQIGIPHGPAPQAQTGGGSTWAAGPLGSGTTAAPTGTSSGTQPPFASSFPSFGTTLTAEQQNALERRKQEEQYLMARQKEHLAQQQMLLKMSSQGSINNNLQHHNSAHSLHSQPSFGSVTSPGGFQGGLSSTAPQPGQPGFFDNSFRPPPASSSALSGLGSAREQDLPAFLERMNVGRQAQNQLGSDRQQLFQTLQASTDEAHSQNVAALQNERARLQIEQQQFEVLQQRLGNDERAGQASAERLQEFHGLRASEQQQYADQISAQQHQQLQHADLESHDEELYREAALLDSHAQGREMSLTEQVQRTQSEQQMKQSIPQQQAWQGTAKIDTSTAAAVQPFPPPTSQSPMPAPVAQRKQNLADQLNAESRSQSQTPSVDTPSASIAPWAKETSAGEGTIKGPSLREIQEIEAKKAAEREAIEAATRRARAEQELLAAANAPVPAPGLPSGATWASGASDSPVPNTPSAWTKPTTTGKVPAAGLATPAKKTLAQIQKEEEARKQRQAAAAAAASASAATQLGPGGKRYADLASKAAVPTPVNSAGGVWTTVGSSGKTKAPPIPMTPGAGSVRSTSGPAVPMSSKVSAANGKAVVKDKALAEMELRKWAVEELKDDIGKGQSPDGIYQSLSIMPAEPEIIVDIVHAATTNLDSRHFAEEYIRRRRHAEKGIVDPSALAKSGSPGVHATEKRGGEWSEVAKKPQPAKEEASGFRVVPKKKGGRK